MRLVFLLLPTLFSHTVTTGRKCSETRCCAGFHFDASGVCIVCPLGLYGVQCSTPCPRGTYGELCKNQCQCPVEFCNASIGCISQHEKELPGPPILYIVIPVSAGLFILFLIICTVV
uniref:Platelet endothelial aggregation receptor 1-like n=1 Tax=Crassostrea virginica TaxID=6565 RepID=A0A8B8AWC6_CRAVI|nr:platelet endothelial aggregation receptor 1-like [Crassostrea virginica]